MNKSILCALFQDTNISTLISILPEEQQEIAALIALGKYDGPKTVEDFYIDEDLFKAAKKTKNITKIESVDFNIIEGKLRIRYEYNRTHYYPTQEDADKERWQNCTSEETEKNKIAKVSTESSSDVYKINECERYGISVIKK